MIQFETEVIDIIKRTENVKSFRFKTHPEAQFKAGQFFFVTILIGGQERTKHFSFSNSPTETGYIEFTKKLTNSDYSKELDNLKIGDWAKLKMPLGSFTFEGEYQKIAFLSGGIGITPIRSIVKYVLDKRLNTDMILLYGNRSERDIVFKDDLDRFGKETKLFKVVHVLREPSNTCRTKEGFINKDIIEESIPDFKERHFYICGPPAMVESMKSILTKESSLEDNKIITENFAGY